MEELFELEVVQAGLEVVSVVSVDLVVLFVAVVKLSEEVVKAALWVFQVYLFVAAEVVLVDFYSNYKVSSDFNIELQSNQ